MRPRPKSSAGIPEAWRPGGGLQSLPRRHKKGVTPAEILARCELPPRTNATPSAGARDRVPVRQEPSIRGGLRDQPRGPNDDTEPSKRLKYVVSGYSVRRASFSKARKFAAIYLCYQLQRPPREQPNPAECGDRNRRDIDYLKQGLIYERPAAYRGPFITQRSEHFLDYKHRNSPLRRVPRKAPPSAAVEPSVRICRAYLFSKTLQLNKPFSKLPTGRNRFCALYRLLLSR